MCSKTLEENKYNETGSSYTSLRTGAILPDTEIIFSVKKSRRVLAKSADWTEIATIITEPAETSTPPNTD